MKKLLISILFLPFMLMAQQDPMAKEVLDASAAKMKKAKAYKSEFVIVIENKQDGSKQTQKGSLAVKGKMYKLKLDGMEVVCDGVSIWNYLSESNEVNITKAGNKSSKDLLMTDPSEIFSIYEKAFKYKYVNSITYRGRECHEINLYPKDLNQEFFQIKLFIDKVKNEMVGLKYYTKAGIIHDVVFSQMVFDTTIADTEFRFNEAAHPGVEVNDLRF